MPYCLIDPCLLHTVNELLTSQTLHLDRETRGTTFLNDIRRLLRPVYIDLIETLLSRMGRTGQPFINIVHYNGMLVL